VAQLSSVLINYYFNLSIISFQQYCSANTILRSEATQIYV